MSEKTTKSLVDEILSTAKAEHPYLDKEDRDGVPEDDFDYGYNAGWIAHARYLRDRFFLPEVR